MEMQFTVNRRELIDWMQGVIKSFSFGDQLHEIFKCVRIHVAGDGKSITMEASDTISYVKVSGIPIEDAVVSESEGVAFLIYAEILHKILAASDKERISFSLLDHEIIICTEGKYKVPALSDANYPVRTEPADLDYQTFGDLGFLTVMDTMSPFAAKELVRPELAGVSVSEHVYVSTVGNYGAIHSRVEDVFAPMTIFPYVIKFLRACYDANILENVYFAIGQTQVVVKGKGFFYMSGLPTVEFPFEQLHTLLDMLPEYFIRVKVSSQNFFGALKRVLLLDTDRFSQLRLRISSDTLGLVCQSGLTGGVSSENISVENYEAREEVGPIEFNLSLASIEALRRLFSDTGGNVVFSLRSKTEPIFVRQAGSRYTFYTMAMRDL